MREILFRGKTLGFRHDWVYGGYVNVIKHRNGDVDWHYIIGTTENDTFYKSSDLVDPKTVGQFTGFLDVNGKKIFEGDIVERAHSVNRPKIRMRVVEYSGSWYLCNHEDNEDFLSNWCNSHYLNGKDIGGCIVVGNIHDNPELMKAEGE